MKHYLAEYDYNDAIITFTAKNRKEALNKLIELTESKGTAWDLQEVEA
jgi:hypothetical protein